MRKCSVCNEEINPKRLEILPKTQTCVQHSTVEKKVAVTVQMGQGDHTWTETFAVEREEYDRLEEMKGNFTKSLTPENKPELVFTDDDDIRAWDPTLLDGLDEVEEDLEDDLIEEPEEDSDLEDTEE
jgi:hypothetical protein